MGVSSVTLFYVRILRRGVVFIGDIGRFLSLSPSLTFFGLIPHTFQWKNVTFLGPFRAKGDRWGEG